MADTLSVDICYRPLRIGWAVREGDWDSIRRAVRYSNALWGGRFNPILIVDRLVEARCLVKVFRVDMIWPMDDSDLVRNFIAEFPYLQKPFFGEGIFDKDSLGVTKSKVLDLLNSLSYWQSRSEWKRVVEAGLRVYEWAADDPLADFFRMQFGSIDDFREIGEDYVDSIFEFVREVPSRLEREGPIPADIFEHPSLAHLGILEMEPHYSVRSTFGQAGIFLGDVESSLDMVAYWNLRATDTPLFFIDKKHIDRFVNILPIIKKYLIGEVNSLDVDRHRSSRLWSRYDEAGISDLFDEVDLAHCMIDDSFWLHGMHAPMMQIGTTSTLGVLSESGGMPVVNFALSNKKFDDAFRFYSQHLIASISIVGGLYRDEQHTFSLPYVPQLNEFFARSMHYNYRDLRVETERIGLVIDTNSHDDFLVALPVQNLMREVFALAGFGSSLNQSGRVLRQLLAQLEGLQGARVFKIPGARKLLKKFGPRETFSRQVARDTIVDKTPENRSGTFGAHRGLHLGPRAPNTFLTPPDVFTNMVSKGLFRIGVDLECVKCAMTSWVAVDALKQQVVCELCGKEYDGTVQLVGSEWRYRRSGVLGAERNAQGAVPVALTLQQLATTLSGFPRRDVYSPSLDLVPLDVDAKLPTCEVDFVWLSNEVFPERPSIIVAECKDQGSTNIEDFRHDFENLRQVANAIPASTFAAYMLYAKLVPFTAAEIEVAREMNAGPCFRVILLTARELEPYFMFERLEAERGIKSHAGSAAELAKMTHAVYFQEQANVDGGGNGIG